MIEGGVGKRRFYVKLLHKYYCTFLVTLIETQVYNIIYKISIYETCIVNIAINSIYIMRFQTVE